MITRAMIVLLGFAWVGAIVAVYLSVQLIIHREEDPQ